MRKNRFPENFPLPSFCLRKGWRIWSAAAVLLCSLAGISPAHALDRETKKIPPSNIPASAGKAPDTSEAPGANKVTFNFVNADIESVIAAVGDYANTTFIIDPRVKGTITLKSEEPLTRTQAFQLLTSVLRLHGYTVVTGSGYSKVVPEADAKLQAGPIQAGGIRGDQIATQVFHLNFESAANLVAVLRPLISPNNTINANPGNNTLVITDYADNLLRLGKIIAALDDPARSELEIVPIRHAIASDMAAMVNRLLEPGTGAAGGEAGRTSLLVDSRSNSVIVRAPSEARANLAKSLIAKLDQPTAHPGNVHVVYLKNAEATKLAQTLRAVISSDPSTQHAPATPTSPAQAQAPLPSGGPAGFIQADASTNTLIITANEAVYRNLRSIIDQLDARRAQVYIESLIVEVSATRAAEFGVQWGGMSGDSNSRYRIGGVTGFGSGGDNLINQAAASTTGPLPPGNGLSVGIFRQTAGQIGLGALARALASDDDANILSMPNLITLDNEEAKIIVGQNVPFVTGQYTTTASGGGAGVNPFQTIERKDIGLSLRVRPQISEGGTVKMAIYQETSSVFDSSGTAGIVTNKRSIDTNVLVDDGQIIVLGGLIDDSMQDSVVKVPGLGDIPIIGNLFKYQKRSRKKTNLMVFLRPTVVRSSEQSVNLATDRYDFIRNEQISGQPEQKLTLPDMGAPLLPPLQDGRMVGGTLSGQPEPGASANTQPVVQQPPPPEPAP
ncbi:MAG: type II secretion system protein GspD [Betaproteobacteria bacterium RBG_16_56_24]|nr:MAG: type II secretion system protein GspD [Betaproteobacteria bacterium RBG_16_56_24]